MQKLPGDSEPDWVALERALFGIGLLSFEEVKQWIIQFLNVNFFARANLSWQILRKILTTQFCNKSQKIIYLLLQGGRKGHFTDKLFNHRSQFVQTNHNSNFLQVLL